MNFDELNYNTSNDFRSSISKYKLQQQQQKLQAQRKAQLDKFTPEVANQLQDNITLPKQSSILDPSISNLNQPMTYPKYDNSGLDKYTSEVASNLQSNLQLPKQSQILPSDVSNLNRITEIPNQSKKEDLSFGDYQDSLSYIKPKENTIPTTNVPYTANPISDIFNAYRANNVNNDLIQQTSVLPTKQSIPTEASNGYTPIGGVNMGNVLDNPNIPKPQNDLNYKLTSDKVNPYDKVLPTEQLQQPQVTNNVTNPTSVKGVSSWVDPTTKKITYGNTGFTPNQEGTILNNGAEGRTTINGKVDKNSDFYKRNKQAESNLSMTGF